MREGGGAETQAAEGIVGIVEHGGVLPGLWNTYGDGDDI